MLRGTHLLRGQQVDINEVLVIGHQGHHFKGQVGPWVLGGHREGGKAGSEQGGRARLKEGLEHSTKKPQGQKLTLVRPKTQGRPEPPTVPLATHFSTT